MTLTTEKNPVIFNTQIPVNNVNVISFKKKIIETPVKCVINGARVNNTNTVNINLDISFRILSDLEIINPGTSITGKSLYHRVANDSTKVENVKGKNVTLNFDLIKCSKNEVQVTNVQELYSILSIALKDKELMDKDETGSIITKISKLNTYLKDTELYLTGDRIDHFRRLTLELKAIPVGEKEEKI